ncbi:DUF2399 domain-containing protein [Paenibacillus sp. ISL-20]|uniref:DUF2399 domain-containing protein n=1 Tax=Paenibacillus sp. ISL-20 TaxID=2819163 RepID=UPI001BEBEE2D|nr:DUF2399 domain-containing protein [Paenibacillus sp. ISL-20]MBT2765383.1 DUF2399 domain-containing protein [Paenibacillus sp. ISL-20]
MTTIDDIRSYLSQHILKSGEQLDPPNDREVAPFLIDMDMIRKTARTFRKVGVVTVSVEDWSNDQSEPDRSLLKWTIGKRAVLPESQQTFQWLREGWIMKELRFQRDGRTVDQIYYRMGFRLFSYLYQKADQKHSEHVQQLSRYQDEAQLLLDSLIFHDPNRSALLSTLKHRISESLGWGLEELVATRWFPLNWNIPKRIKFLTFCLAFLKITSSKNVFDWKEIGSYYYEVIGGSKAFDLYQHDFIMNLENWSECSADSMGYISSGKITPLYFAGHLSGTWSVFLPGPVHALTDLSISQGQYHTNASILWLVENRGILTRMAAEADFVADTGSLIVCVDGHLRTSHRIFLMKLLAQSNLKQVILWSDYDEHGLMISREMADVVSSFSLRTKWICHNHAVVTRWSDYEQYMGILLQASRMEQEQIVGEAEEWKRWIQY